MNFDNVNVKAKTYFRESTGEWVVEIEARKDGVLNATYRYTHKIKATALGYALALFLSDLYVDLEHAKEVL